jgi:hypothetical protein
MQQHRLTQALEQILSPRTKGFSLMEKQGQGTPSPQYIHGKASIVRGFFEQRDMGPLWSELYARVAANTTDAAAFLDLSVMLQTMGDPLNADLCCKAALETSTTYKIRNGNGTGLTVLVFMAAGDFMANTPIEFLLESSNVNLLLHYVDAATPDLNHMPQHDVAFVAVSQSAENQPILDNLEHLLQDWRGPVMNGAMWAITQLTRDGLSNLLKNETNILSPQTVRVARESVQHLARGQINVSSTLAGQSFPITIRPFDTHAGKGLEKISAPEQLNAFLELNNDADFYVAPFIDYRGADGKFRKQRVAIIDGRAYASHMAVSEHWMVHYLNADMTRHESRRREEALWMETFDHTFSQRHREAFDILHEKIGLEYFAIDCAEMPDGRLLVFEADNGMIVHAMDPADMFAYKKKVMEKLFAAFEAALIARSKNAPQVLHVRAFQRVVQPGRGFVTGYLPSLRRLPQQAPPFFINEPSSALGPWAPRKPVACH